MTFTLPGLILLIVIAAVCAPSAGDVRGGLVVSIVIGFIGVVMGPWLAARPQLPEPLTVTISGHPFGILWSIIGAALFVAIIHLISRR